MLRDIKQQSSGLTAKILLGLIIISFVFWGVGSQLMTSGNDSAAVVNGDKVSFDDFNQAVQVDRNRMTQQFGDSLGSEYFETENYKRGILNRLVESELLKQEASKFSYDVRPERIKEYIESAPALQIDGKFSKEAYANYLKSVRKSPEMLQVQIEDELKTSAIPLMISETAFSLDSEIKKQNQLSKQKRNFDYFELSANDFMDKVEVTDEEIENHYTEFGNDYMTEEKVSVNYIELSAADVASEVEVTDEEVATYYTAKKDSLTNPEKRKASHILLPVSGDDAESVKAEIEKVAARIASGEDFVEVAKEVSKDPGSAPNGGDLGWVSKGDMVKPFEDKLFSMNEGEISEPVLSDFGYHIIKLDEIQLPNIPTLDEIKETLVDELKQEKSKELFLTKADELDTIVIDSDNVLEVAAENFGLSVQTTEAFTRRGGIGVSANQNFIQAAFSDTVKTDSETSQMVDLGENHIAYLHINEHMLPTKKPLEEVSDIIKNKLKTEKSKEMAQKEVETLVDAINKGEKTLSEAANEHEKTVTEAVDVERIGSKQPFMLVKNVFSLKLDSESNKVVKVDSSGNSYAVVMLKAVNNPDSESLTEEDKSQIASQIERTSTNNEVVNFTNYLKSKADVNINEKIFETNQ